MKTHNLVLKDFSLSEFHKMRYLTVHYPLRLEEPEKTRYAYLVKSLLRVNSSTLPVSFKVTKDEFRLLVIIIDIMSMGERKRKVNGETLSYEEVHGFFTRLEQKFIRTFQEGVYADADSGASTLREQSEHSIGSVHGSSNPPIGASSIEDGKNG